MYADESPWVQLRIIEYFPTNLAGKGKKIIAEFVRKIQF